MQTGTLAFLLVSLIFSASPEDCCSTEFIARRSGYASQGKPTKTEAECTARGAVCISDTHCPVPLPIQGTCGGKTLCCYKLGGNRSGDFCQFALHLLRQSMRDLTFWKYYREIQILPASLD